MPYAIPYYWISFIRLLYGDSLLERLASSECYKFHCDPHKVAAKLPAVKLRCVGMVAELA